MGRRIDALEVRYDNTISGLTSETTKEAIDELSSAVGMSGNTQTVIVDTVASQGDFTSIKSALDSITDSSSTKPYLVLVYPGLYSEDPMTVPASVSVESAGVGAVLVSPNNNSLPLWSLGADSFVAGFNIDGPSLDNAFELTSAVTAKVKNVTILSGLRGFQATNPSSEIQIDDCRVLSGVGTGIYATGGAELFVNNLYSEATTGAECNNSTININNSVLTDGTNGLYSVNFGLIRPRNVTIRSATNGLRVDSFGEIVGSAVSCDGCTFDLRQDNASAIVQLFGSILRKDRMLFADLSNISAVFENGKPGDRGLAVTKELHVGMPELGSESLFGEGGPYCRGIKVLTTDGATSSTTDGGNITDVSSDATSFTGSTFTFQGAASGHSILFGSELSDGSDVLKHWGYEVKQTIAASEVSPRSFVFEIWDGSNWTSVGVLAAHNNESYRYADEVFIRSNLTELLRFGISESSSWSKKTIDGSNLYWSRIRIETTVTTAPVFEQIKLCPSFCRVSPLGFKSFFGMSRQRVTFFATGNVFGEDGGVDNASIDVGTGTGDQTWTHRIKNSRLRLEGDTIFIQFPLAKGIDTSFPINVGFTYNLDSNVDAGNGQVTISVLPQERVGVKEADPTGGLVPVERSFANTETLTSKAASVTNRSIDVDGTSDGDNKLLYVRSDDVDISSYYPGDHIIVRIELSDDGDLGNQNINTWTLEVEGVRCEDGERL